MSVERKRPWPLYILGSLVVAVLATAAIMFFGSKPAAEALPVEAKCGADEVQLVASQLPGAGTVELLGPIVDTDGSTQEVYDLRRGGCIPRALLLKVIKSSGAKGGEAVALLVAVDPKGTVQNFRSRFDFEADPAADLDAPKPPLPPGEMRFGEAAWSPAMKQLLVTWYSPGGEWYGQFAQGQGGSTPPSKTTSSFSITPSRIPGIGRCHMGECSWSRELSQAILKENASGTLVKITLLGGSSSHPDDDYPAGFGPKVPISWARKPHDVFVFCSLHLPAVMMAVDGAWQTDVLDFNGGIPGVLESSAALYSRTCHSNSEAWLDSSFAARNHYRPFEDGSSELELSSPQQIFNYAG